MTHHTSQLTHHKTQISHPTSHITHITSHITHHTSHITHHTSRITHHTSHITHHTSHVTHHTSHITHHTSHITCDGSVHVWHADTALQRAVIQCPQATAVAHLALSHDGRLLAVAVGATPSCAHVFDVASAALLASPAVGGSVQQLQWSAHAPTLHDDCGHVWTAP